MLFLPCFVSNYRLRVWYPYVLADYLLQYKDDDGKIVPPDQVTDLKEEEEVYEAERKAHEEALAAVEVKKGGCTYLAHASSVTTVANYRCGLLHY